MSCFCIQPSRNCWPGEIEVGQAPVCSPRRAELRLQAKQIPFRHTLGRAGRDQPHGDEWGPTASLGRPSKTPKYATAAVCSTHPLRRGSKERWKVIVLASRTSPKTGGGSIDPPEQSPSKFSDNTSILEIGTQRLAKPFQFCFKIVLIFGGHVHLTVIKSMIRWCVPPTVSEAHRPHNDLPYRKMQ